MSTAETAIALAREALLLAVTLALPALLAAFGTSLLCALLQSLTKTNEPALSFVPRLVATAAAFALAAPWISERVVVFTERLFALIATV
jgi:flagellar biosynthesis protein FliQ